MRVVCCFALLSLTTSLALAGDRYWPQSRGPNDDGVAAGNPPLTWSESENIEWRVPIPGRGHSSPVIWQDRIFLTTAVPTAPEPEPAADAGERRGPGGGAGAGIEHQFLVLALDRNSGEELWRQTATVATPPEGYHRRYGSFASNTPVTDGERLYAFFGSRGLYCYDLDGNLLWEKRFPPMRMRNQFGEGVSPVLDGDNLFLKFDHEGDSYLLALDKHTGRELWRVERDEVSSWSPPLVLERDGRRQVVVSASNRVRSYDAATGELIWESAGLGTNVIPAPVASDDLVYVMSGHRDPNLMAIRLGRKGDLTGTEAIVWTNNRGNPYTASPVLHEGKLYLLTDSGMLSSFDARTGEPHYHQQRLPNPYNFKSSPVAAAGRLYLASEEGDVIVVRLREKFEVLAINSLPDRMFIATPAIAGDSLYLRSQDALYRIRE